MPPQVPPRTYVSRFGNRKNLAPNKNRRISVDPVRGFYSTAFEGGRDGGKALGGAGSGAVKAGCGGSCGCPLALAPHGFAVSDLLALLPAPPRPQQPST